MSDSAGTAVAQTAALHDGDAIAEPEQFRKIAADHQHGARFVIRRVGNERVDQPVNLRLAADVDPAGRFVENEDVDVVVQQSRDRDLLLIAA